MTSTATRLSIRGLNANFGAEITGGHRVQLRGTRPVGISTPVNR
jgi:hypothetical protein